MKCKMKGILNQQCLKTKVKSRKYWEIFKWKSLKNQGRSQ